MREYQLNLDEEVKTSYVASEIAERLGFSKEEFEVNPNLESGTWDVYTKSNPEQATLSVDVFGRKVESSVEIPREILDSF